MFATVSITEFRKTHNNFALSAVDCTKWHRPNSLYKQTEPCSCFPFLYKGKQESLTEVYIQDCPYYLTVTKAIGEVHTKSSTDFKTIKSKPI